MQCFNRVSAKACNQLNCPMLNLKPIFEFSDYIKLTIMFKTILLVLLSFGATAQTVYKTPSGAKYHLATCRMVKNVSEEISTVQAKELGLQACKICNPANIYGTETPEKGKAKGESNTVQCKGTTKSGSRCKHMTSIANGYCFQHSPDN